MALTEPSLRAILVLVLCLGAAGAIAWLLYRRFGTVAARPNAMPYLDHLEEIRVRVLRSGLILLLWTTLFLALRVERAAIGSFWVPSLHPALYDTVAARVYAWIVATTVPTHVEIVVLSPTEAVGAQFQVALLLGAVVSFPFLLYEAWAFFSPGLASREQRIIRRTLGPALLLFVVGAAFGYAIVVPLLFQVLYGFATPLGAHAFLAAGTLVGTVAALVLLFGAAFELPLVMAALVRLRILTPEAYLRKWRHATIGIFVAAALASDPTLTSQLIIGVLLLLLYWGGVLLSFAARPSDAVRVPQAVRKTT